MKVCDMCLEEMYHHNRGAVTFTNSGDFLGEEYNVCSKCRKKLKKYIKFEQAKNKQNKLK